MYWGGGGGGGVAVHPAVCEPDASVCCGRCRWRVLCQSFERAMYRAYVLSVRVVMWYLFYGT